jgi:hypothetical protein
MVENNSNNQTEIVSSKYCGEALVFKIINYYFYYVSIYLGTIFNFVCIFIFLKICRQQQNANQGNMYKYLTVKSVCDFLFLLMMTVDVFFNRIDGTKNTSFVLQVWLIIFDWYAFCVTSLASVMLEIAASIDCYLLISNIFTFLIKKKCFYIVTAVVTIFCVSFYVPLLFFNDIVRIEKGQGYKVERTRFYRWKSTVYYFMVHDILRDVLPVIILSIINILILVSLRNATKRRKNLAKSRIISIAQKISLKKSKKAELNKMKMILFTNLMHIFHLPMIIYNLQLKSVNQCYTHLAQTLLVASYSIPIISYILYNNNFKKFFIKLILIDYFFNRK